MLNDKSRKQHQNISQVTQISNYTNKQLKQKQILQNQVPIAPKNKQNQNIFFLKQQPQTIPQIPNSYQNNQKSHMQLSNIDQSSQIQNLNTKENKNFLNERVTEKLQIYTKDIKKYTQKGQNHQNQDQQQRKQRKTNQTVELYMQRKNLEFYNKFNYRKSTGQIFNAIQNCIIIDVKDPILDVARQSIKLPKVLQTPEIQCYKFQASQQVDIIQKEKQQEEEIVKQASIGELIMKQDGTSEHIDLNEYPSSTDPRLLMLLKDNANNFCYVGQELDLYNLGKFIIAKKKFKQDEASYQKMIAQTYKEYFQDYPKKGTNQCSPSSTVESNSDKNNFDLDEQARDIKTTLNFQNDDIGTQRQIKKAKQYHVCIHCWQSFENGFQLGGHTSKKHPGKSLDYQNRKIMQNRNIIERNRREYFKRVTNQQRKCPEVPVKFQYIQIAKNVIKDPAYISQLASQIEQENQQQNSLKQQEVIYQVQQNSQKDQQKSSQKLRRSRLIRKQRGPKPKKELVPKKEQTKNHIASPKKKGRKAPPKEQRIIQSQSNNIKKELSLFDLELDNNSLSRPIIQNIESMQEENSPNSLDLLQKQYSE